jgi:hypothetical protein
MHVLSFLRMDCVSNVGTRADFAESRLADIRLKLQSEKDAALADALRKAQAEAEATVARIKVRSCMVYGAASASTAAIFWRASCRRVQLIYA